MEFLEGGEESESEDLLGLEEASAMVKNVVRFRWRPFEM